MMSGALVILPQQLQDFLSLLGVLFFEVGGQPAIQPRLPGSKRIWKLVIKTVSCQGNERYNY